MKKKRKSFEVFSPQSEGFCKAQQQGEEQNDHNVAASLNKNGNNLKNFTAEESSFTNMLLKGTTINSDAPNQYEEDLLETLPNRCESSFSMQTNNRCYHNQQSISASKNNNGDPLAKPKPNDHGFGSVSVYDPSAQGNSQEQTFNHRLAAAMLLATSSGKQIDASNLNPLSLLRDAATSNDMDHSSTALVQQEGNVSQSGNRSEMLTSTKQQSHMMLPPTNNGDNSTLAETSLLSLALAKKATNTIDTDMKNSSRNDTQLENEFEKSACAKDPLFDGAKNWGLNEEQKHVLNYEKSALKSVNRKDRFHNGNNVANEDMEPEKSAAKPDEMRSSLLNEDFDILQQVERNVDEEKTIINNEDNKVVGSNINEDSNEKSKEKVTSFLQNLPIHAAMRNPRTLNIKALRAVLSVIDPKELLRRDTHGRVPLSLAIQHNASIEVLFMLLNANRQATQIADKHHNVPLHIACMKGCNLTVIRALLEEYPATVHRRNFHDLTCIELCETCGKRGSSGGRYGDNYDDVINYLQKMTYGHLEGKNEDDLFTK
eukprot:CAMPEP_0194368820 /NCGR_PEP_ID=MMETSP0174-20130528/17049_1 /TAXON_ID=216777 /ORGANISM="Proboscia alata, Strain PI-D3" /LENGTH=542 /DNA_ID=CAMNT_0039145373 /DNA_START=111 /DNA_END=1739 /DNA_ORIENTATION=-